MDKNRAVVVTGIGIFTSIGCNRIDFWNSLIAGKMGCLFSQKPEVSFDANEI